MNTSIKIVLFVLIASIKFSDSTAQLNRDNIVFLTNSYLTYLERIKFNEKDAEKIYKEEIEEKLFNAHFQKSEFADIVKESFVRPIKNNIALQSSIEQIIYKKSNINGKILEVLTRCRQKLNNDNLTIYILPSDPDNNAIMSRMSGIMGLTAGSKQILITIDPNCAGWEAMLEYALAHEFNHAYLLNTNTEKEKKWTLLDYLLFEGKGDSFAHFLYPGIKAPWTTALTETQKTEVWNKIKSKLQSEDMSFQTDVMFGSSEFPLWAGYTLGYAILQSAFKNNMEVLRTNWTDLSSKELLEMSSYKLLPEIKR